MRAGAGGNRGSWGAPEPAPEPSYGAKCLHDCDAFCGYSLFGGSDHDPIKKSQCKGAAYDHTCTHAEDCLKKGVCKFSCAEFCDNTSLDDATRTMVSNFCGSNAKTAYASCGCVPPAAGTSSSMASQGAQRQCECVMLVYADEFSAYSVSVLHD